MHRKAITKALVWTFVVALSVLAQTPSPAAQKPLSRAQILSLLAGDVPSSRVSMLVQERGIDFKSDDTFLDQVRKGGGEDDLVAALQSAHVTMAAATPPTPAGSPTGATGSIPPPVSSTADAKMEEARQEELAQHAARGAELLQKRQYAEAEAEYRAAIKLDPQESNLHMALSRTLIFQKKTDEAMQEAHLAIRLNPESDMAHFSLGNALRSQQDWAGAAAEYREAIRLNPNYAMTHNNLGVTLRDQGDLDGAIAEYHVALQLNPHEEVALANLGNALERTGDLDGAIAQYQTLTRQRPRMPIPHFRLGQLLEKKGEPRRALREFREATNLAPENRQFRAAYERALQNQ